MSLIVLAIVLLQSIPVAHHTPAPVKTHAPPRAATQAYAGNLFSRRALHRSAIMLRLRWEELRLAQLERVRAAIQRQIPIDDLLKDELERK
ncbi:MAG: hypothetical protein ACRENA_00235 [Vulcanimicrobiaceae bacterium]